MMNLLHESGCQKLVDLLTNDLALLLVEAAQSLVVRTGLLQHLVENRPLRGTSRLLALDRSDQIVIEGLTFVLPCFLLVVALFGPPAGTLVVVG